MNNNHRQGLNDPFHNPMRYQEEGVDHINIFRGTKSLLGNALRHDAPYMLEHSLFGKFKNMECFWFYLQSDERDDRIRTMEGKQLREFSEKLHMTTVRNFRAIIMDSNYQKVLQHPNIKQMLQECDLPLECYFVNRRTGMRQRPGYFRWLLAGFQEIRLALKEQRAADMMFLADPGTQDIYEHFTLQCED